MKNDIENLLFNNKNCKGIISSRVHGYKDAKFEGNNYLEIEINDFDNNQIKEYVEKWYEENEKEQYVLNKEVNEFMELTKELESELVSNPLLLSLVVILYRNNGKLPSSKLDIYRSCTNTLVEEWDENKNLEFEIAVKNKKVIIFSNLAIWQYEKLSQTKKKEFLITNEIVKNQVHSIISKLKITDDFNEADNYQSYEVKGNFSERNKIISKYINNSYWHIVLELLIYMIDRNQGDEEIIDALVSKQLEADSNIHGCNFLVSIISKIINISDEVLEQLLQQSIEHCLENIDISKYKLKNELCYQIFYNLENIS